MTRRPKPDDTPAPTEPVEITESLPAGGACILWRGKDARLFAGKAREGVPHALASVHLAKGAPAVLVLPTGYLEARR